MGSVNKTSHLQLPQWLGNEYLKREDMNDAFAKIDANAKDMDANVEAKLAAVDTKLEAFKVEVNTELEARIDHAVLVYEQLSNDVANKTVSTCVTNGNLDTWTSVITRKSDNVELARRVDVESATADGYCVWTSTITIAGKASVVWTSTETATGWIKEVV